VDRVGILDNEASMDDAPRLEAFRQERRNLRWREEKNLITDAPTGPEEKLPALAPELVRLGVDLIFAPKSSAVELGSSGIARGVGQATVVLS
jgi:hypothetical protein